MKQRVAPVQEPVLPAGGRSDVLFRILCGNVALNGLTNVHVHLSAVGSEPGEIVVPAFDYTQPANFGALALGQWSQGERVPMVTVDGLGLRDCHLIKVDVEGMEGEVLAGAEETIRRCRPVLYVENDRREKSAALIEHLFRLDYRLYWHRPRLFNPDNFFEETENLFRGIVSVNILGVSRSMTQNIHGLPEVTSPEADWWESG